MTVRWKPLLVLTGLFFVVAIVGLIAMAATLIPRSAQRVLKQARAAAGAGCYEDAEIYYKQALQFEAKSSALHEEMAQLYHDWYSAAPADRRELIKSEWYEHLVKAAKFDKSARTPRLQLLQAAIDENSTSDAVYWAREVLNVEPGNADAHFLLALQDLETRSPNVLEVKRHLKLLEEGKASPLRVALLRLRLAQVTGEQQARDAACAMARTAPLPADASTLDRMARIRFEAIEIQSQDDSQSLPDQVKNLLVHVQELIASGDVPPGRITQLCQILEQTQRALVSRASSIREPRRRGLQSLVSAIDSRLEGIFQKVLSSPQKSELQVYLSYADHLRFRQQRERCLQVINEALELPAASRPANAIPVMGMHAVAVEMALSKQGDTNRFAKAEPHIKALVTSPEPRFQGLGHLFQGSIELEQSGMASAVAQAGQKNEPPRLAQPKLRASALAHLKQAAAQLPGVAEAQARYGVALVLCGEQSLGRQYLQNALRLGDLEPQYQIWTAWTILQAGYPEMAEPIVEALFHRLDQGAIPREVQGTLHQIKGEIHQARRGPGDLEKAAQEFERAAALEQGETSVAGLRLAQIDVQMNRPDVALERLKRLRESGRGGPGAEQLSVLIYEQLGKKDEARNLLRAARARYPKAADLAGLEAALSSKDGKPAEADKLLEEFLAEDPDNVNLTLMRAQILADALHKPAQARELLLAISQRSDSSMPLVQLAHLEMQQDHLDAAAAAIATIRKRWSESATGDILDGQLALKRKNASAALAYFSEALKKDPDDKVVQLWKAQLDSQTGSVSQATRSLEDLIKNKPSKEVDTGVTLMTAAQSALANLDLQSGKYEEAIRRFEELKRSGETGTLSRSDRWQLINAYIAKRQWPQARRELASILNDTVNPPTDDDRVRGANIYHQQKEHSAAIAQLDYVLEGKPTHPAGVIVRAYIDLDVKNYDDGINTLRKAIELSSKIDETTKEQAKSPAVFFLMLAAIEYDKPPAETAAKRAKEALEQGLAIQPNSLELVQAEYLLLSSLGDVKGAIDLVQSKTKDDPKGTFRRLLADVLRQQRDYEQAERVLRQLLQESPDDLVLAAALVQLFGIEASAAGATGNTDKQHASDEQAQAMIRDYRARFPGSLIFLQADCELAARQGDYNRALAITDEIDKAAPNSSTGPLLRAALFARQKKSREVAQAYSQAVERNPQPEIRILLGQELYKLGDIEGALDQARQTLQTNHDRLDAILLEAKALSLSGSTDAQKEAARREAKEHLEAAIARNPRFAEAYHTLADIEEARGQRSAAIEALRRGLQANPSDAEAIGRLMQLLAARKPAAGEPSTADLEAARKLAAEIREQDRTGALMLAAASGLHKVGQFELALPLAQAAASKLDSPAAHLGLGDLWLSMAESQADRAAARPLFIQAVAEYDRVLKTQPGQIEAVNNKAWILHTYLDQSQQALDLVQDLMKRVDPAVLPGEFYDTLGTIQQALGRQTEAEQSFQSGLGKAPNHPVLNYHFGKLLAADHSRMARAKVYLAKALAGREQLSPAMAQDAEILVKQLSRSISGN
ncbi:MAG: tetratricopeptide repeat protein [Planctomycetaceae bacterium]|nr:tetratricopeptide repeat protein [Planctomycetaceae bacterium]